MGAMEGTVQEGSIPTWIEVVFFKTFFSQKIPNYFWERFIENKKKNLICEKKLYINLKEYINKPSTLRDEQNIRALT